MTTRRTRTRRADVADATATVARPHSPVGASGNRVVNVGPIAVEVFGQRGDMITSVGFPLPDEPGTWAVVQISQDDGTRWMLGLRGWQHDEYPTLHAGVEALCDRKTRVALVARTAHARKIAAAEHELRAIVAAMPTAPEGVYQEPTYPDPIEVLLGLANAASAVPS
jgi:hypothetical protein